LPYDTAQRIKRIDALAAEAGKNVEDYTLIVGVSDQFQQVTVDVLKQYRDAGVQPVVVRLPTADPERIEGALDAMGEQLVAPAQGL
jgi:hypothetical protein